MPGNLSGDSSGSIEQKAGVDENEKLEKLKAQKERTERNHVLAPQDEFLTKNGGDIQWEQEL